MGLLGPATLLGKSADGVVPWTRSESGRAEGEKGGEGSLLDAYSCRGEPYEVVEEEDSPDALSVPGSPVGAEKEGLNIVQGRLHVRSLPHGLLEALQEAAAAAAAAA